MVRTILVLLLAVFAGSGCSLFQRHDGGSGGSIVAPADAIQPGAYSVDRPATHRGFIPWVQCTVLDPTTAPNDTDRVVFYEISCVEADAAGNEHPLGSFDYGFDRRMDGLLYGRGDQWGRVVVSNNKADAFSFTDDGALYPVGKRPDCLYHGWPSIWPRFTLRDDTVRLIVRIALRCYGNARVQIGGDLYPEAGTLVAGQPPPEVIEAGTSRWASAADGLVTLELGK